MVYARNALQIVLGVIFQVVMFAEININLLIINVNKFQKHVQIDNFII